MKRYWTLWLIVVIFTQEGNTWLTKLDDNNVHFIAISNIYPEGEKFLTNLEKNMTSLLVEPLENVKMAKNMIEKMTNFTFNRVCFQPEVQFVGDNLLGPNLYIWTKTLENCHQECEKREGCYGATMTGPWNNNQMYKCYLLEFDPIPIEKLNHDYVSFRKNCIPKKNEISPEFLKNYQGDLKKDLNHVENQLNGWMQKIVQLLKLNYFQDYNEETNNVLVNRVKRQTQIFLDTKGLGEAVHSIGNFVAHIYHYTRNRNLQAQINDMSHFMLDLTNNYETFQMETVDFEQKNLFLHSLNRIYAKGNLFFMNICQQLQRTYDGLFELIKGTISQKFINFKTAVNLYETLNKTAQKSDLELSYSNITSLYNSDFKTNWHTIDNSSLLQVQLQTPTIDKKHKFLLYEMMNFPIKINKEHYILDTAETFFAINDGYWFNLTNGIDFLKHQNRTVDDRNYTTFTSHEFHGKCQFKPGTGYFCQGFDIHSSRRNRCLSNMYFGYMENCKFTKYSGDNIYVKRSLNGELVFWTKEEIVIKKVCQNGTETNEKIDSGVYKVYLPEQNCVLKLPNTEIEHRGSTVINTMVKKGFIIEENMKGEFSVLLNSTRDNAHMHFTKLKKRTIITQNGNGLDWPIIILIILGGLVLIIMIYLIIQSCRKPIGMENESEDGCYSKLPFYYCFKKQEKKETEAA